jgi:hypothetical protein
MSLSIALHQEVTCKAVVEIAEAAAAAILQVYNSKARRGLRAHWTSPAECR